MVALGSSGTQPCQYSRPSRRPSVCAARTPGGEDALVTIAHSMFCVAMAVVVVKLGSSIVAEDSGELRLSTVARVCEEGAALHATGTDVVVVTSGAIARGMH